MITTAEQLHKFLDKNKNFDFVPKRDRDESLYMSIKKILGLPDGEFMPALRQRQISAEEYLRALIEASRPLSIMYKTIWDYAKDANFLRSKEGAAVEWEIEGEKLDISLEHFRVYEECERKLDTKRKELGETKNRLMEWLAHDVFKPGHTGLPMQYQWTHVEMFRILEEAKHARGDEVRYLFGGLNNLYLGNPNAPKCPQSIEERVTKNPEYKHMLQAVRQAFGEMGIEQIASRFIELPFWKFRWQIYELWVVVVSVREFEKHGFEITRSSTGNALTELGQEVVVATHPVSRYAMVYQPTFDNAAGREIRPDLVVASDSKVTAENSKLIIECKQRVGLDPTHVNEVAAKYGDGVDPKTGQVVIVNYDDVATCELAACTRTRLILNARPDGKGEQAFIDFLSDSHVHRQHLWERWYVDVSMSMQDSINQDFRDFLKRRLLDAQSLGGFELFSFDTEVRAEKADDLQGRVPLSNDETKENWEGHGIAALCSHIQEGLGKSVQGTIFVVASDIGDRIKMALESSGTSTDNIRFVNPGLGLPPR